MRALAGGGLVLEPQTASHAPALFAVLHQAGVYDFLDDAPPVSIETLTERLTRLESRRSPDGDARWLNWIVRSAGQVVGYVQATVVGHRAWVAYVLGSASWGRGIASAAMALMIEELATTYGVSHLTATVDAGNAPSIRLLQRLGFTQVASGTELKFERML